MIFHGIFRRGSTGILMGYHSIMWLGKLNPKLPFSEIRILPVATSRPPMIQISLLMKWLCLESVYPPTWHFNDENDDQL